MSETGYVRVEGPEQITPPYQQPAVTKQHSFESLSAAHVLSGKLGSEEVPAEDSGSDTSPAMMRSAAAFLCKQREAPLARSDSAQASDDAVDCLMSLSSAASAVSKRKAAPPAAPPPRRKLRMRPSPLAPADDSAPTAAAAASQQAAAPPPTSAVPYCLSGASMQQLRVLATAFKLCPTPTEEQLAAVAQRVGLPADRLAQWFESRHVLQGWVQSKPDLGVEELQSMFYNRAPIPSS